MTGAALGRADSAPGARNSGGALEVVHPGAAVSIQDLGRRGHRAMGVPLAGAADAVLMACANALLSQHASLAVLEVALLGPTLRALHAPVCLAVVGDLAPQRRRPGAAPQVLASWRCITLQPGDELALGPCRSGIAYVALAGGAAVPLVLGSRSTYARAGLGGISGRAPLAGDVLACGPAPGAGLRSLVPFSHAPVPEPDPEPNPESQGAVLPNNPAVMGDRAAASATAAAAATGSLRVLPGPQDDHFDADNWERFLGGVYTVTRDADRMGLRLQGPALKHRPDKGADIVSEAVVPGAVQVPGAGQPIVLGVDAQTIGGYAKIATVISADLPRLAHARPGSLLRFVAVTRAQALAARQAQAAALAQWVQGLVPLQGGDGPAPDEASLAAALATCNLISGMIDACRDPYRDPYS